MYEKIGKVDQQLSGLVCVETDDLLGGGSANAPKFHRAIEQLRKEYTFGKWKNARRFHRVRRQNSVATPNL